MHNAYIVTGTLTDEQTIKLDEALPLAHTKVRLAVEPLPSEPKQAHDEVIAEIWARQAARGFVPPTPDEVDAYLRIERESWNE